MSEGLLSISGLASGLDTENLINQIMEFEGRGITRLESRIAIQQKILGGMDVFEAKLLALQVDFGRLSNAITFRGKSVTSSDETVLTAAAAHTAAPGTFSLTVDQLAQSHQIVTQGYAARTSEIGTGTFSLTVGDRSRIDITIDASNNTLEGLAEAVNEAGAGASASVINSGDPDNPYLLLITAEGTGSSERIVVDANLAGGTAPQFGSVAAVVEGSKTGTSTVSSSGNYTGDASGTLTYTVTSGGTVGVDNIVIEYTDGADLTGSFTIGAGYVPGEEIDVFGGVKLSFSAGTLDAADNFSTGVASSSIQAPLDAKFTLGNSLGGASGITLTSSTNRITDVVEGVTFDLHKVSASPVTVTVDNDTASIKDNIKAIIDQYNGFVDTMDELFYFEEGADETGVLLGDRTTIGLYSEIQQMLTSVTEGVTGSLTNLGDVGITISSEGKLVLDESELDDALENKLDSVLELFATAGNTTDADVRFLGASRDTVAYTITGPFQQGYDVQITRAAERALITGTQISSPSASAPIVVDSSNSGFKISMGNRESGDILISEGVYNSGEALAAEIQAKIDADENILTNSVTVKYVDDGGGLGHFEISTVGYGSGADVTLEAGTGNTIYATIGQDANVGIKAAGEDVAGTINGEAATGVGRILTGDDDNEYTEGLKLEVTITADELAVQGGDQGFVTVTKGIGSRFQELMMSMTDIDNGDTTIRKNAINEKIQLLEDQIDSMEVLLEKKRERLLIEFLTLESALADLQSQQDYLNQSLTALAATTTQVINSK